MKKYYLFVFLAALIGLSSCNTLRIEKRHYNKGFYVDFGNDKSDRATAGHSEQEAAVAVEVAPQPEQENSDRAIPATIITGTSVEHTAGVTSASDEVINEPTQTESTRTEVDQQMDATRVESDAPVSSSGDSDVALILLVILAIILPPLAVFLVEGTSKWFWVTLILCIFGGGFFFTPYLGGLWLIAAIIALLVVLGAL